MEVVAHPAHLVPMVVVEVEAHPVHLVVLAHPVLLV